MDMDDINADRIHIRVGLPEMKPTSRTQTRTQNVLLLMSSDDSDAVILGTMGAFNKTDHGLRS